MSGYVYIKSEDGLFTVGFYKPDGTWFPESDHVSDKDAAERVHWLNGGELKLTSEGCEWRGSSEGGAQ